MQRIDRVHGHAGHDAGLAGVLQRHDHPADPGTGGRSHHRQYATDRADRAVEAELAQHHDAVERGQRKLARTGQQRGGDGQVDSEAET
ncbi:hypothetical protein KRMM14A1259_29990 [Krasilnikovia sp. MM14-A1259]